MEQDGRKKIIVRNTKYGAIKTIVQYLLQFVLRTIFIYVLGKEYLGLNGVFSNILGCLNIVELGIGTAIVFSMYKPIAENDVEKIKSLNALYKKCFRIIAIIITSLGLAIIPILKFLISGDIPSDVNIYAVYLITLFDTVIGYLWAHKRSLLFAYQRNDVESKVGTLSILLLSITQIVLLLITRNYYSYIICKPIFSIIENMIISNCVRKLYPDIKGKAQPISKAMTKEIQKNVVASSMNQIGGVFVTSTDNILISAILGLSILGIYTNYATIISCITACITLITYNARSTIGNMVASESSDYVYEKYKIFNFIMYWITGFCTVCLLCLLSPFVYMWTNASIDYLLDFSVVIVLVINFYITNTLSLTATYTVSAGLMWQNKWKTIIQGIVNIVFSIWFTHLWGIIGIFIGTLASYISAPLWMDTRILHKYYFKKGAKTYWFKYIIFSIVTCIVAIVCNSLCNLLPFAGILWFILKACICLVVPNVIYLLCFCRTSEFKQCFSMAKEFVSNLFSRKKKAQFNIVAEQINSDCLKMSENDKSAICDEDLVLSNNLNNEVENLVESPDDKGNNCEQNGESNSQTKSDGNDNKTASVDKEKE